MTDSKKKQETPFTVFAAVDKAVSKDIIGSDGAARWQSFQADNASALQKTSHVAPTAPLKHSDRASGITSWEQERSVEEKARKESGTAPMNNGYTKFAEKPSMDNPKERKRIEERRIGANQQYFFPSSTFTGWKWDYVFTTKEKRGTGYYFDGMDSLKEQRGELKRPLVPSSPSSSDPQPMNKKPKKTKKEKPAAPVILSDPTNPREQVMATLAARQNPSSGLPPDWSSAIDPTSNKTYYFHRTSGERSWEKPSLWKEVTTKDAATGQEKVYYYNSITRETRWDKPTEYSSKP